MLDHCGPSKWTRTHVALAVKLDSSSMPPSRAPEPPFGWMSTGPRTTLPRCRRRSSLSLTPRPRAVTSVYYNPRLPKKASSTDVFSFRPSRIGENSRVFSLSWLYQVVLAFLSRVLSLLFTRFSPLSEQRRFKTICIRLCQ